MKEEEVVYKRPYTKEEVSQMIGDFMASSMLMWCFEPGSELWNQNFEKSEYLYRELREYLVGEQAEELEDERSDQELGLNTWSGAP